MKQFFTLSFTLVLLLLSSCDPSKSNPSSNNNNADCKDHEILRDGECLRDSDGDFIPDIDDNCVTVPNYDQSDTDNNGIGDVCEDDPSDRDHDGFANEVDNCPDIYNPGQEDEDNNGVGDACEPDPDDNDNDGVANSEDNCPDDYNPGQEDEDNNGVGDACDNVVVNDSDNDGVEDGIDNCPNTPNPNQEDSDGNGTGDACENQDGTQTLPFIIPVTNDGANYTDTQDTSSSSSSLIDSYPPDTINESGPEYYYVFTLPRKMVVHGYIHTPEPSGVDVDIHLLSTLSPVTLIDRGNASVSATLDPGTYYFVLDTYESAANAGSYALHVDIVPYFEGSHDDPVLFGVSDVATPITLPVVIYDQRDTSQSSSSVIDTYPPNSLNESGPEFYYAFTVNEPVRFAVELMLPEPAGTDVDVHLLSSLSPVTLVERDDYKVITTLDPGTYYIVIDTYNGIANAGEFLLNITIRAKNPAPVKLFNSYILDAIEYIDQNYALLGYDMNSVLTHDIPYGSYGTIPQTGVTNKTMCVAASMEIILTAMTLYAQDTGDNSVWDFLPMDSYRHLGSYDIKAHIWVNYGDIDSGGTADALRHFGMGMNVPFEELIPGSFVNINRTTGSGHSVTFVSFIDSSGTEYTTWNSNVVGFKYYSSQGSSTPGSGGMSYRYAFFSDYGCPDIPNAREDCNIIYSESQHYLNTGIIYSPQYWRQSYYGFMGMKKGRTPQVSFFDPTYFTGHTISHEEYMTRESN